MIAANDTDDIQVGDTFGLEDRIYEVVECLSSGDFRLNDGRASITLAPDEIAYCPRVAVL
jgi:hypothetical protein